MVFLILVFVLIAVLAFLTYQDNFQSKRPPGPFRLPFIGNILQLGVDKSKAQHEAFRALSQKYGSVSTIQIALYPAVIFDDFETIKKLLNHELWVDRFFNSFFAERSFGKALGIIFISGEVWKEMRRFTIKTLKDFGYGKQKSMEIVLEDEVKDLLIKIENLRKESSNSILEMKSIFAMPVLNVLWSMVCCTRTADDDKRLNELLMLVDKLARATPIGGGILLPFPFLRNIFPEATGNKFIRQCNTELQAYFWDVLRRRREEGVYKNDQRDYIDVFLKEIDHHREQGSTPNYYTDEQFVSTTIDLFEAGAETTNNTLEFAMSYMIQNPAVQKKVQDEIDRVVGRNRLPTHADKTAMPYTEAVITETQRLSNVLPMTVRSPTEDVVIDGYVIKKGTIGFMNLFSVHMDEKFWGDPETFRPERFLDSNMNLIANKMQRVMPFGAGRRLCIGEALARATLFTYFTTVLQHFTFEKIGSDSENDQAAMLGFTLTPAPFSARIIKR